MKLLVFLLLISSTIFSQDVVFERFYKYTYKANNTIITTSDYNVESEEAFECLQNGKYIQITTDNNINFYLSDTLTKLFVKGKSVNEKLVMKTLSYMVNNITIDSTTNLFYKEVENTCNDCRYSIKKDLLSDCELVKRFNSKGVTKILVTYVQLKSKGGRYGCIYVVIHKRFRKDEQFLYIDDMK